MLPRQWLCLATFLFSAPLLFAQDFSFLSSEENRFVNELTGRLSTEEKVGQMTQLALDLLYEGPVYAINNPPRFDEAKIRKAIREYKVGSFLNVPTGNYPTPNGWYEIMQRIQNEALNSGAKIPVIFGQDAIHGVNYVAGATLYPQPLGMAATFNRELAEACADFTAYEMKAASIPWNFSPAMDVGRNPVWPRTWESFGEDTYLNQEMGLAMIRGYQGEDVADQFSVAACLKHFTGYGAPLSGRDRSPVYLGDRQLREHYFPQYQAAIDAGALTIMINSGEVNGIPVHASHYLLTEVLREEMGFEGLLVSDWEDLLKLVQNHRTAPNMKEATYQAVMAGMDMAMVPVKYDFSDHLLELIEEDRIPESRIDLSVRRILAVKVALGLFEQNVWNPKEFPKFGGEEFADIARTASEEAVVLLKNDGILPFSDRRRILVTGPTANTMRSLNGGWTYSWQGEESDDYLHSYRTILEALMGDMDGRVNFVEGASFDSLTNVEAAVKAAGKVDVVVVCLGETSYTENPGNIDQLTLPAAQRELVRRLAATGKPLVLVMAEGRPRVFSDVEPLADAILYAPYPGPQGGDAISGILNGRVNPSGKLPLTYPRHENALLTYDHKFTEGGMHGDPSTNFHPLYEFGHGLSYTEWEYDNLTLSSETISGYQPITISVELTNAGERAGKHAVLLFTQDEFASVTPSVRRLRDFTKVELRAGETRTVTFEISAEDLAFVGRDGEWVTEPGTFKVMVGDQVAGFRMK